MRITNKATGIDQVLTGCDVEVTGDNGQPIIGVKRITLVMNADDLLEVELENYNVKSVSPDGKSFVVDPTIPSTVLTRYAVQSLDIKTSGCFLVGARRPELNLSGDVGKVSL